MKIAIYGDCHITKKMNAAQEEWDNSVLNVFRTLYADFESKNVEMAICLGDMFDKAVLEAKNVKLVTEVLSILNNSTFPTHILLGNHEIYDYDGSNILEYLTEYENIIPVTDFLCVDDRLVFIPYNCDIVEYHSDIFKDRYLFTHHDIYGMELAGGSVKATFGIDPNLLSSAKRVFNGHVHLHSKLGNILNVGSLLKMSQGELRKGESPRYYILDTNSDQLEEFYLSKHFIAPLTADSIKDIYSLMNQYDESVKFLFRLNYEETLSDASLKEIRSNDRILKVTLRKVLVDRLVDTSITKSSFDIRGIIKSYIEKDDNVPATKKDALIELSNSLLEEKS